MNNTTKTDEINCRFPSNQGSVDLIQKLGRPKQSPDQNLVRLLLYVLAYNFDIFQDLISNQPSGDPQSIVPSF